MLNVSQELKDKVTTLDFKKELDIIVIHDGVVVDTLSASGGLVSFRYTSDLFQNGNVLGSVIEQSYEIEVVGEQRALFETNKKVTLKPRFYIYTDELSKEEVQFLPRLEVDKDSVQYNGMNRLLSFKAAEINNTKNLKKAIPETDVFSNNIVSSIIHIQQATSVMFEASSYEQIANAIAVNVDFARYHGATYLDVLSDIAEILGGSFRVKNIPNDTELVSFVPIQNSLEPYPISKNSYWDIQTTPNNMKVHGVNTVVLSLNENVDGENVTVQNGNELTDGVISLNIYDNQIIWNNDLKETFKNNVSNRILNYHYTPFEMQYIGYPFLEVGDKISFFTKAEQFNEVSQMYEVVEKQHTSYIHSLEFVYNGGTQSTIKAYPFENNVEKRVNTNPIKQAQKKTELYVDKELGVISSTVSNLDGKITTVTQDVDGMKTTVAKVDDTIDRVAELELTSESIRLEMSQIGGYNLISNVVGRYDYLDWTHSATPFIAKKTAPYAMVKAGLQPIYAMNNEQRNSYSVSTDLGSGNGIRFWKDGLRLSKIVPVDNGTDYSLYTKTKGTGTLTFKLREYASGTETNKNNFTKETVLGTTVATENWATFTHTITTQATTNSVCLVVQSNVDVYAQQYAIFSDTSFNIGQPKPFGESLTDVNNRVDSLRATVELNDGKVNIFTQRVQTVEGLVDSHSSQLTIQSNEISSKVNSNGIISAINQTAETVSIDASKINLTGQVSITTYNNKMTSIDNTLSSHGSTLNSHTSSISSLGNEITLKVSKGDVASTINQTAQSVKIEASKINLTGYATFSNLQTSGQTSIHGANIQTGTINADRLSVTSLSAINSNLGAVTAGSISGTSINIGSGNFTVNTSGVVVAKSITTTGTHGGTTNGTVNANAGYHTGASTFTSTSGNFSNGTLGGSGYSASGSNASFSGRVVTLSGFSTAYTSYLGSILPNADTNTLGNFSTRWNKFFCQYPVDVSSDIRLKENFVDVHDDFNNFIYSLPIGTYNFKNDNIPQIGVNANFVDGMLPSEYTKYLITKGDNGYYSANYVALVPMLVKVVQSQNTRLIDLEYEVAKLKGGAK